MSNLETALTRLDAAMTRLETAFDAQEKSAAEKGTEIWGDATPDLPELRAERDQLVDEVKTLRTRAEQDAELRAEAADAVREALRDLRGMVGQQETSAHA